MRKEVDRIFLSATYNRRERGRGEERHRERGRVGALFQAPVTLLNKPRTKGGEERGLGEEEEGREREEGSLGGG